MTQEEAVLKKQEKMLQRLEDYKAVFKTEEGKRVLEDLGHRCHFLHDIYDKKVDGIGLAHRDGARSVFMYIISQVDSKIDSAIDIVRNIRDNIEKSKVKISGGNEDAVYDYGLSMESD